MLFIDILSAILLIVDELFVMLCVIKFIVIILSAVMLSCC